MQHIIFNQNFTHATHDFQSEFELLLIILDFEHLHLKALAKIRILYWHQKFTESAFLSLTNLQYLEDLLLLSLAIFQMGAFARQAQFTQNLLLIAYLVLVIEIIIGITLILFVDLPLHYSLSLQFALGYYLLKESYCFYYSLLMLSRNSF